MGMDDIYPFDKNDHLHISGIRVKGLRKRLGLSQADVSAEMGVSVGYISHLEVGRRAISKWNLTRLSAVLGCEVSTICDEYNVSNSAELIELCKLLKGSDLDLVHSIVRRLLTIKEPADG